MGMKRPCQLNKKLLQRQVNHSVPFLLLVVHLIFNGGESDTDILPIHQDAEACLEAKKSIHDGHGQTQVIQIHTRQTSSITQS